MPTLPLLDASDRVFIAGPWRAGASRETLPLVNPSDGSTLCDIARGSKRRTSASHSDKRATTPSRWHALRVS